ncbi:histone-lysine N-methyltransferase SETMAR [Plakobranchus ocellatus]|uniref:Histone-lysine N-methyltransferase SETMAR n=1 Tax=Plakobranchus ocellatus TaxID=259542 RepID=A0AAV3YRT4_9GAST|nr:histone-lysine N-methyltransferase SETMAR [Plakobranchus ocellatus]
MATSNDLLIKQRSVIEFWQLRDVLLQTIMAKMKQFVVKCAFQTVQFANGQLTVEMKAQRKDICTQLLEHYNAYGDAFLQRILTGDEPWIHD